MQATDNPVRNIREVLRSYTKSQPTQNDDKKGPELANNTGEQAVEHGELALTVQWMVGIGNYLPHCIKVQDHQFFHPHEPTRVLCEIAGVVGEEEEDIDDDLFLRLNISPRRQYQFVIEKITPRSYPTRNLMQRAFMVALGEYIDDELDDQITCYQVSWCFHELVFRHPPCISQHKNYYEAILFSRIDNKCNYEGIFWHVLYEMEKMILNIEKLLKPDDSTLKKHMKNLEDIIKMVDVLLKSLNCELMAGMIDNKTDIREWLDKSRPLCVQAFWPHGTINANNRQIRFVINLLVKLKKVDTDDNYSGYMKVSIFEKLDASAG